MVKQLEDIQNPNKKCKQWNPLPLRHYFVNKLKRVNSSFLKLKRVHPNFLKENISDQIESSKILEPV
jgi:hypothetical protein